MVPEGDVGGEARNWPAAGMLMRSGVMLSLADGATCTRSSTSRSSTSDWKNNRMLVLGKRMQQLEKN